MARNGAVRLVSGLLALAFLTGMTLPEAAVHDGVLGHRRVAAAYLRTGNVHLALNEIESLEAALEGDAKAWAGEARTAVEAGDLEKATAVLARLRTAFAATRKARGIRILADCIAEAEASLAAIDGSREARPALANEAEIAGLRSRGEVALTTLELCRREAPPAISQAPEFRRLVDGATLSLSLVPTALETRDRDLLHRLLIELRSFERLLVQRFG